MKPIRFSDSPLRWVSALPMWPGGTKYQGQSFDFLGARKQIEKDLTRQIDEALYQPPILKEHTPDGTSYGQAVKWRLLTDKEAAAFGLPQKAPLELYLGLDVRDAEMARAYDEGRLTYSSPDIRGSVVSGEPYIDETGTAWDFFIGEISAVGVPHNKQQTAASHLRGVQMKDKRKVRMSDGTVVEIETEAPLPEGATMVDDAVSGEAIPAWAAALVAGQQELMAKIAALEGAAPAMADPAAAPPAVPPAAVPAAPVAAAPPAPMMNQATMNDRAVEAAVNAALAKRDAAAEVDALLAHSQTKVSRERLIALHMSDKALFAEIAATATPKPGQTNRSAVKGTGNGGMTPLQQFTDPAYAAQMRDRHTKDGKFDKMAFKAEYDALRAEFRFSPVQGAA